MKNPLLGSNVIKVDGDASMIPWTSFFIMNDRTWLKCSFLISYVSPHNVHLSTDQFRRFPWQLIGMSKCKQRVVPAFSFYRFLASRNVRCQGELYSKGSGVWYNYLFVRLWESIIWGRELVFLLPLFSLWRRRTLQDEKENKIKS
jgi:hypothetical protein